MQELVLTNMVSGWTKVAQYRQCMAYYNRFVVISYLSLPMHAYHGTPTHFLYTTLSPYLHYLAPEVCYSPCTTQH